MLLARPITIIVLSGLHPAAESVDAAPRVVHKAPMPVVKKLAKTPLTTSNAALAPVLSMALNPVAQKTVTTPSPEFTGLPLQSVLRSYTFSFQGSVACPSTPCEPELELMMDSVRNPDLHQKIPVQADGTFHHQMAISELPGELADWRLIAREPRYRNGETHGRQILNDDLAISISRDLHLR
jgi:hypothetical protein